MGQGSITEKEFEKIVIFLKKNFRILSPDEWISNLKKNSLKKKDICITFDDALLSQYNIALRILNKHKIKAFWFIYSSVFNGKLDNFEIYRKFRTLYYNNFEDFFINFTKHLNNKIVFKNSNDFKKFSKNMKRFYPIYSDMDIDFRYLRDHILSKYQFNRILSKMMQEKKTNKKKLSKNLWLDNNHLKKISKGGHIVGMHAYNHPFKLSKLSYEKQLSELQKNYQHLKKTIGHKPISISYPNGSFNHNTLKIIKKLGVECGFLSSMKDHKTIKQKKYLLKRLDHSVLNKSYIK
mgnify:CR=1 FL=1